MKVKHTSNIVFVWLLLFMLSASFGKSAMALDDDDETLESIDLDDAEFFEFLGEFEDEEEWQEALDLESWLAQLRSNRRNGKLRNTK